MVSLAEQLGSTAHLSPLLRKARRLGLDAPRKLMAVAIQRGCAHFRQGDENEVVDPGTRFLPNEELAIALCSAAQPYDPMLIRCAAQLLGADGINARTLGRLARMERCVAVIRHIASAGLRLDAGREEFWRELQTHLPPSPPVRPGVLPHESRFVLQTGILGPLRAGQPKTVWLRPRPAA